MNDSLNASITQSLSETPVPEQAKVGMLDLVEWYQLCPGEKQLKLGYGTDGVITSLMNIFHLFPLSLLSLALALPVLAFTFLKWELLSRKEPACSVGQLPTLSGPEPCRRADLCSHTELSFPNGLGEVAGVPDKKTVI